MSRVLPVVVALVLSACPGRKEPSLLPGMTEPPGSCISALEDLDPGRCDRVGPGRGLSPEQPLEWGPAAIGTLWHGRLVCPSGADPEVIRLEASIPSPTSESPPSGFPTPGAEWLDAWSVRCPGDPQPRTWFASMFRCGDPCPPAGFRLVPGRAMERFVASRGAFEADQAAEALELAAAAVERAPRVERLQYWLGIVALDQDRVPVALEAFEAAAALDPGDVDNLYYLAMVQQMAGLTPQSHATAEEALERVAPHHPSWARITCLGAVVRREQGRAEEAAILARAACARGFEPCCGLAVD